MHVCAVCHRPTLVRGPCQCGPERECLVRAALSVAQYQLPSLPLKPHLLTCLKLTCMIFCEFVGFSIAYSPVGSPLSCTWEPHLLDLHGTVWCQTHHKAFLAWQAFTSVTVCVRCHWQPRSGHSASFPVLELQLTYHSCHSLRAESPATLCRWGHWSPSDRALICSCSSLW
jgi:hypothetical protein